MLKESKVSLFNFPTVRCPHCETSDSALETILAKGREEALPAETMDVMYPIKQIAYRTLSTHRCPYCDHSFIVDFGKSEYNIYTPFVKCTEDGSIELLARYTSFYFGKYYICRAKNPNSRPKYLYYIIWGDSNMPIFLSQKKAMELLKDHHATLKYIDNVFKSKNGDPRVYKPMC